MGGQDLCWERRLAHVVSSKRWATVAEIAQKVHADLYRKVSD